MKIYLKKFVLGQLTLIFALACFALSPIPQAQARGCTLTHTSFHGVGKGKTIKIATNRAKANSAFNANQECASSGGCHTPTTCQVDASQATYANFTQSFDTATGLWTVECDGTGFSCTCA